MSLVLEWLRLGIDWEGIFRASLVFVSFSCRVELSSGKRVCERVIPSEIKEQEVASLSQVPHAAV